ncbi:MAG: YHS domain-containing protein [Acidobacteria bacterium]|nr:YHS domain-containing protein [Acidobacteriota bacterium]
MLRLVGILLTAVVLITLLRTVIGVVMKMVGGLFNPPGPSSPGPKSASGFRAGGELKRDPVCGTFVPAATSLKKTLGGQTLYFCSQACCDRHGKREQ